MNETMNVLVTGATGFIGTRLVASLIKLRYNVRILVRNINNAYHVKEMGAGIICGDICDRTSVEKAVHGINIVYHLAALTGSGYPQGAIWQVNVEGTKNLLEASYKQRVKRFIYCSSSSVMGYHINDPPADESRPYNPQDAYAVTKMEAEKLTLTYYRKKNLPIVIVRPSSVYGEGGYRFVRWFKCIKKRQFIMIGRGQNLLHLIYVDDLVKGLTLCLESNSCIGKTYILAGPEYTTLKELIQIIHRKMRVKESRLRLPYYPVWLISRFLDCISEFLSIRAPISGESIEVFKNTRAYDIAKVRKELGFEPRYSLEKGMELTINWLQQNHIV